MKKRMNVLRILFFGFLCVEAKSETCPALFQRYSQDHTYCLPPNTSCSPLRNKVKASDIDVILREHNTYRSKIATGAETSYHMPKASNMFQLVWNDELAVVAQRHADQCVFEHDCNECRRVKNFDVGQNLYERTVYPDPLKPNWSAAIKAWYDEIKDFDKAQIDCFEDGQGPPPTGHFTQMVWAVTWQVGCGYTMYKRGNEYVELYVCDYGPAGNVKDESMYNRGDPCSECPINSCCGKSCPSPSYPGLCKIPDNSAPQYKPPVGSTFFCSFNGESDCARRTTSGVDTWEVSKTLSGCYIGIVLNGGESSTLNFTTPFKGKKSMCLTSYFRKGPQVAGQDGTNSAFEIVRIPDANFAFSPELQSNSIDWIKYSVALNWNMPTLLSLRFSVPSGKPSQYLELKDIAVREGPCS